MPADFERIIKASPPETAMPPPDCEGWMYDPPSGIREGEDVECGDDIESLKQTLGDLRPVNRLDVVKLSRG